VPCMALLRLNSSHRCSLPTQSHGHGTQKASDSTARSKAMPLRSVANRSVLVFQPQVDPLSCKENAVLKASVADAAGTAHRRARRPATLVRALSLIGLGRARQLHARSTIGSRFTAATASNVRVADCSCLLRFAKRAAANPN
jgi:hypothetical protein